MWVVKHYRIRILDNNGGFFISIRTTFPNIQDLINYYTGIVLDIPHNFIFIISCNHYIIQTPSVALLGSQTRVKGKG
ncbi:unnamed protein product [Schistosoma mattheei]|uniref:Uncharacterized protein n=1 Tax=Schistosoma mattheei TaxID=31246 RepID=A0A183PXK1_9TREM|nr:unnamed protein product [Schistosoma mattheei]